MASENFDVTVAGCGLKTSYYQFSSSVVRVGPGYSSSTADYKGRVRIDISGFDPTGKNITAVYLEMRHTSDSTGYQDGIYSAVGTQTLDIIAASGGSYAGSLSAEKSSSETLGYLTGVTSTLRTGSNYWYRWNITSLWTYLQSKTNAYLKLWGKDESGNYLHEYRGASDTYCPHISIYYEDAPTTYTVTYQPGYYSSGSTYTATKTAGTALTLRGSTYSRTGYTQAGWSTSTYGTSKSYNLSGSYTTDAAITLYPYWTANTYAVSYNPGSYANETTTYSATKTYGTALTLRGSTYTRSGYTQTGWSTTDGGSKAYELSGSYTANAAITLYPYWESSSVAITSVSVTTTTPTVKEGENFTISLTVEPSNATYTYASGWYSPPVTYVSMSGKTATFTADTPGVHTNSCGFYILPDGNEDNKYYVNLNTPLTILPKAGLRYVQDNVWKNCVVYYPIDGVWTRCYAYYGQDGEWMENE